MSRLGVEAESIHDQIVERDHGTMGYDHVSLSHSDRALTRRRNKEKADLGLLPADGIENANIRPPLGVQRARDMRHHGEDHGRVFVWRYGGFFQIQGPSDQGWEIVASDRTLIFLHGEDPLTLHWCADKAAETLLRIEIVRIGSGDPVESRPMVMEQHLGPIGRPEGESKMFRSRMCKIEEDLDTTYDAHSVDRKCGNRWWVG